jgi:hypothetical protein
MIEKMAARAHANMLASQSLTPAVVEAADGLPRTSDDYKSYLKEEREKIDSDDYKYDVWKKVDK